MSKELMDQMLDAGIFSKEAVAQMEQWQTMPAGSAEKVGEFDPKKIAALREHLEIRGLPQLRETVLDIKKIMKASRMVALLHDALGMPEVEAGVDRLGRYIFVIPKVEQDYNMLSILLRPMTRLRDTFLPEPRDRRMITAVSVLYATIKKGEEPRPTHWFCETEAKGEETIIRGR